MPAPTDSRNHCEYGAGHPDTEQQDRPTAEYMVGTRHVEEPETCSSGANVQLCEDCAEEQEVPGL